MNPFTGEVFKFLWLKHFSHSKKEKEFTFIKNVTFIPTSIPSFFINVGSTLTKGLSYKLENGKDWKGKTLLVCDVPEYLESDSATTDYPVKVKKVFQYPGYLVELSDFKDANEFVSNQLSSRGKANILRIKKRLETVFEIKERNYIGEIDREVYDSVFTKFYDYLEVRTAVKEEANHYLNKENKLFYKELIYKMLLKKEASLYVITANDTPISISLNFYNDDTVIYGMPTFDQAFSKYSAGIISIIYLIDWAIKNGYRKLDFSKGHYDYKVRWSNKKYKFNYHIIYDSKSLYSSLVAALVSGYYTYKQKLRDIELNKYYHQWVFFLKNLTNKAEEKSQKQTVLIACSVAEIENALQNEDVTKLSVSDIFNFEYDVKKELFDIAFYKRKAITELDFFYRSHDKIIYYPK